jgi:hypothetical protein
MNKSKNSMKKIGKYSREVSVVVIGVAITLSATLWVSKKNETTDMALYLKAIKIEMEDNITTIEESIEYLRLDVEYEKYLKTHDKKLRNEDTLAYYAASCCYRLEKFTFKTNAFEMFKNSGVMRLMDDKELLLSIWNVYDSAVSLNESLKWYFDSKWGYIEKDFLFIEDGMMDMSKLPNNAPMYNFYHTALSSAILEGCENTLKNTKETVSKLEKRK